MKTKNISISPYQFQNRAGAVLPLFAQGSLFFGLLALGFLGLLPTLQAVTPAPDGGYLNNNTAEGQDALLKLNVSDPLSSDNTAIGFRALYDSAGSSNSTAVGSFALGINKAHGNTGVGAGALGNNEIGQDNTAVGFFALTNNTASANTATGSEALLFNRTGSYNVANGSDALFNNQSGSYNTASGYQAMLNITGGENTAAGAFALFGVGNSTANFNTATGYQALYSVQDGGSNVADGWQALYSISSGYFNTASGVSALRNDATGIQNTASGVNALYHSNGDNNTAEGSFALENNTSGSANVALGYQAGRNLTTGSNNIVIGAGLLGKAGEANTTRIGKTTQTAAYIGGIYNKTVASASGVAVRIDSTGKLGTVLSSARYKDHIQPMKEASEAVLQLEPVTFRYKKELDPDGVKQFGLIAEQVEKIDPDLVVKDEEGRVSTVRYEAVNAMLLNEFLKAHRQLQQQRKEIAALGADLAEQKMLIRKVNEQLATNRAESQTIAATFQQH